jgi:hypothetical protein
MADALTKAGYEGVIVVCTPSSERMLATPRQPKKAVKKAAKRPYPKLANYDGARRVAAARGKPRSKGAAMIVEERLARLEALLIGAWCAFDGDRFGEDGTNKETIMRFLSMGRGEVRAMQALGVEMLNIQCRDPPTKV